MAEVTYTAEDLNNYTKKQLTDMFLEKESMSKSISDLTSDYSTRVCGFYLKKSK